MGTRTLLLRNLSIAIFLFVVISQSTLSRISNELYQMEEVARSPMMRKEQFHGGSRKPKDRTIKQTEEKAKEKEIDITPDLGAPESPREEAKDDEFRSEKTLTAETEKQVHVAGAVVESSPVSVPVVKNAEKPSDNPMNVTDTVVKPSHGEVQNDSDLPREETEAYEVPSEKIVAAEPSADGSDPEVKTGSSEIIDFEKQDGAVIVTKIHGMRHWTMLEQMLCLLHQAYNKRGLNDILIFTTESIPDEDIEHMRKVVSPAKFMVALESNMTLHERVHSFRPEQRDALLKRCNVTAVEDLNWFTRCDELGLSFERLMYTWQAEFRSLHVWSHPALVPYKWMMWLDTDAFCSISWQKDPIAIARRNDLALFFMNFPAGMSRGSHFSKRFIDAFNTSLCAVHLKDGHLSAQTGGDCPKPHVHMVHGFFHISNLDFYRSPRVMHWARTLIGNETFSRMYDDQLAVTAPAAVYAGNRSWDMHSHGVQLDVFHNSDLDGKKDRRAGGFRKFFKNNVTNTLPGAVGVCNIVAASR